MRVAILCEYSGIVRDAFIARGHDAISVDLLPTERPGPHYQGDVFHFLCSPQYSSGFDLAIGFWPCTYACNSGVRWLYNADGTRNEDRWHKMQEYAIGFRSLMAANAERVCMENPVMHKYALDIVGVRPSQIIQPYEFGHTTSKKTCLWLKNLPLLRPTHIIPKEERTYDIHLASPGPDRWKIRSRTFQGIADAMAEQWSNLPESNTLF